MTSSPKSFLLALQGKVQTPPPIWLMRQAGRYLPEYRATRKDAGSFLDLCYNPDLACEVTLQPIRRYGFDAAILFSDILIVPDALGQNVRFVEGEGPRLDPLSSEADIETLNLDAVSEKFGKIYQTVSLLAEKLPRETALIGFCGAPWTVATYMIGGRGSPDQAVTRLFAYQNPKIFARLMDKLVEASAEYLLGQVKAGAEALQIFDSWAGNLPEDEFQNWVIEPTVKLIEKLRAAAPDIPIIGFPRGAGPLYKDFVLATKVDGVSCDTSMPLSFIRDELQPLCAVQGNLDPLLLIAGGAALDRRIDEIKSVLQSGPFIFNLGHGITPPTPPENVARMVERIRS